MRTNKIINYFFFGVLLAVLSCTTFADVPNLPDLKAGHDTETLMSNNAILMATAFNFSIWFRQTKEELENKGINSEKVFAECNVPSRIELGNSLTDGTSDEILTANNKILFEFVSKSKLSAEKIKGLHETSFEKWKIK